MSIKGVGKEGAGGDADWIIATSVIRVSMTSGDTFHCCLTPERSSASDVTHQSRVIYSEGLLMMKSPPSLVKVIP